jgi:ubiquinone biosynthesis protein
MSISFERHHLKRYKDIGRLLYKYGRTDVAKQFNARAELLDGEPENHKAGSPEELTDDLEKMGPTYVKLGQILSSRADLLPERYLKALSRLQDKVKPFPYEDVERIITAELGVRISKAFAEFDKEPLAAASLGQVHKAKLRDGREVVVKVQRPDIRKQIADDLQVLEDITTFLDDHIEAAHRYQLEKIFAEFQKTLIRELDYQQEASNLTAIADNLAEFDSIVIPRPVMDFCTRGVLTMEYIPGVKITDISPVVKTEMNGSKLADDLFKAYLKQLLVDGLFHSDPHPGNVLLTPDNRVGLIDLGMVGRTTPGMQEKLLKLLLAIAEGRGDDASDIAIQISETTEYFNDSSFRRKIGSMVAEHNEQSLDKIDVGRVILEIVRAAGENGLYVPVELTMLGKTLLQLDTIGRVLDDKFSPRDAVRRHVDEMLAHRMKKDATPRNIAASLLEMKDFVGGLPLRVNKILDAVGNAELELKVRTTDIHSLLEGFQKVANRITTGLVLAGLIVGAALLMRVDTAFRLFGYPGLAIVCFLLAAGGGFWLIWSIALSDHKAKKRKRRSLEH